MSSPGSHSTARSPPVLSSSPLRPTGSFTNLRRTGTAQLGRAASVSVDTSSAFAEQGEIRSGRALSVSRRARDEWVANSQEKAMTSDPRYRKYANQVERTLLSIDQVNEWADFITFLAKLLKTLQSHPSFPVIPHKLTVAKRLSQCLNPALPQGVHQRALDVYGHILTTIGADGLRRDLQVWSAGLFPFFQYAATGVRPIVIDLFERYYLLLQADLRPAMKAFILALLPGLEEETGEHFDQVCSLLDRLSGTVSPAFFLQNLWLILITGPGYRIPALNYLSRRMPKLKGDESIAPVVGEDVGLMVRGFAAALEDGNTLVQRGILDLMLNTLRLDSSGFKKDTRPEDQLLLMRSALSVVLRRDLSLSRRLSTWLLGPASSAGGDELSEEDSVAYLKAHALNLVTSALKAEMGLAMTEASVPADLAASMTPILPPGQTQTPAEGAERQKPFKIFVSLLDKWEIGASLVPEVVLDAFTALRMGLRPGDPHDELLLTANMLFDALDPFLTWKKIFETVSVDMPTEKTQENLALVHFVVKTFRLHDEELLKLHVPLLAFSLIDMLAITCTSESEVHASDQLASSALDVIEALLGEFTPNFFGHALAAAEIPATNSTSTVKSSGPSNLELARYFYRAKDMKEASTLGSAARFDSDRLVAAAVSALLKLVASPACNEITEAGTLTRFWGVLDTLLQGTKAGGVKLMLYWQPEIWVAEVLKRLRSGSLEKGGFICVQRTLRCMLALSSRITVTPRLHLDERDVLTTAIEKLFDFLQGPSAPHFVESVRLVWELQSLTRYRHVETIIASRLVSDDPKTKALAFEAFGNLWRYTEDTELPGTSLRIPMLLVLDTLKDEDLATRRYGEAWMRCSLKSYLRVLDPLFITLLSPLILRQSAMVTLQGETISIEHYLAPFDYGLVEHALDCLVSLARFGGQGFARTAKGCLMKHSHHSVLRKLLSPAGLDGSSYLNGMVSVLNRFIISEPLPSLALCLGRPNQRLHATAADLLQILVSRGELTKTDLRSIEDALVRRLFLCVHRRELDLQNKLLHVLHAIVNALVAPTFNRRNSSVSEDTPKEGATELGKAETPLFVRVLADGMTLQTNSAVIHYWVDFLLMTVPQFRRSVAGLVNPLIDRLVVRLREVVENVTIAYNPTAKGKSLLFEATDSDFAVLVNALERLLVVAIDGEAAVLAEEDVKATEKAPPSEGGGFLGGIGGVFGVLGGSEPSANTYTSQKSKSPFQTRLDTAIVVLLRAWDIALRYELAEDTESATSRAYFTSRIKVRARKGFERLYKALPGEVVEAVVEYWSQCTALNPPHAKSTGDHIWALLDHLAPSAQSIVAMIYDRLAAHGHLAATEKGKTIAATSFLSENTLFQVLECYIDRLEGPIAVQVWSSSLAFARDVLANPSTTRSQVFPTLRCFTTLSDKISQTSALEDRRMRRDLQDTFVRLVEASISGVGRWSEGAGWTKSKSDSNGDASSVSSDQEVANIPEEEKRRSPSEKVVLGGDVAKFLTTRVLPGCRRLLIEGDKISGICSSIMYYIVTPSFKTRSRSFDVDPVVVDLLLEMTKHAPASKAWRGPVSDAFADNRFFNNTPGAGQRWRLLIQALVSSDKERFADMLGKISTAPSANIFTNRELEMMSRSFNLRRITYTVFAGEYNRFLVHLPSIQEKVVDLLRSNVGEIVHAEVYLCMRVLLCRIGNQHLAGFWPVILTELTRLFESLFEPFPESPHFVALVLSASKFLDLLLVLQTAEFQIHQWMFVTDTVDAIYPPDRWSPHALIDRLSMVMGDRIGPAPALQTSLGNQSTTATTRRPSAMAPIKDGVTARRPLLTKVRRIDEIRPLEEFFSRISLANYEALYGGGPVDWAAVEEDIEMDMFDG